MINQLRQGKEEIARLKANQRQRSKANAPALQNEEEVKRRAKHFAVMYELFLDNSAFENPKPAAMTLTEQYASEQARIRGITFQLYEFLPCEYHEWLGRHKQFAKTVRQ